MGAQIADDTAVIRQYIEEVRTLLANLDLKKIREVVGILRDARERGSDVYVVGNGGSAATASHFATDLNKATKRSGSKALRAISLVDNTVWLSALANDHGYENIFSGQLENLLTEGDVLVAISVSGNSANVVRAVEFARRRHAITIALVGFDGGRLLSSADFCIHVTSEPGVYGPVEDTHLALHHMITNCLAQA